MRFIPRRGKDTKTKQESGLRPMNNIMNGLKGEFHSFGFKARLDLAKPFFGALFHAVNQVPVILLISTDLEGS